MKLFILISSITLLISCSKKEKNYTIINKKEITIISNKNTPSNPEFKISLEKLFSIKGFDKYTNNDSINFEDISQLQIDKDNNIYISDSKSATIRKFNYNGKFITSFGGKGQGPGEFTLFSNFIILNDTIVAIDNLNKIIKFSSSGEFICEKKFDKRKKIGEIEVINYSTILSDISETEIKGKDFLNDRYLVRNIALLNNDFIQNKGILNKSKASFKTIVETDGGFFINHQFCSNEENIYIAYRSKDQYKIDVFDLNYKKTKEINKFYRKIKYTDSELNYLKRDNNDPYFNIKYNYKVSIIDIITDKKSNYLWVENIMNLDKNLVKFDIFKDGIYINSHNFIVDKDDFNPLRNRTQFYINNGRFYYYSKSKNELNVFNIHYINGSNTSK
ncbi:MAG: hypothetical protein CR982_04735 [Candidatus Cloacimonadota bacterium]|nr:MAG: hypothetical protein CR982_04735 [Candidatus Cloacimonadota bacterium]PIE81754.1 MAG: hypothetical protein CSA15_00360 [Candidatus Delongbacteria bacterium]